MDDDGSGWDHILREQWGPHVRERVVTRIEQATVGRRGWLVRALAELDGGDPGWTETVHAVIVAAIQDETGADLDALGSQAAWECYEQVWGDLAGRWADGGDLATVRLGHEPEVVALVRSLPDEAAAHAGADVSGAVVDPLWLAGRLRIDVMGLRAYLRLDGGPVLRDVRRTVERILAIVAAAGTN